MRNRPALLTHRYRRGITLLFVISLIVLFLLMGTSFVLLASQYRKSATANSRIKTRLDTSRSLINRAFLDLLREPDLNKTNSPLRGHSILGDAYGYGVKAQVYLARRINNAGAKQDVEGQMFAFRLDDNSNPADNAPLANGDTFVRILDGQKEYLSNTASEYEGQVLSFVDGPLAGTSVRILAYTVTPDPLTAGQFNREFIIIPGTSYSSNAFADAAVPNTVDRQDIAALDGSTVIINRRDFSGTGAGLYYANDSGINPGAAASVPMDQPRLVSPNTLAASNATMGGLIQNVYGPDEPPGSTRLNLRSLSPVFQPNRAGESVDEFRNRYLAQVVANRTSFANPGATYPFAPAILPNPAATNEDYDAADEQNMFLAHVRPDVDMEVYGPKVVPSFYRPQMTRYVSLIDNASFYQAPATPPVSGIKATSAPPDPSNAKKNNNLVYDKDLRRRRDLFLTDMRNPDGSPYYVDLIDKQVLYHGVAGNWQQYDYPGRGDGIPDHGWDVDNDGDGIPDSIWMDIGLPVQTDSSGRRLRPLVAYMVLDMDSRLNVNAHGNLTQTQVQANRFKTSQAFLAGAAAISEGQGYGPPEVSLATALADPNVEVVNLMRGATIGGLNLLGRYGSDLVPGAVGRDPASEYKLFNYPDASFIPGRGLLGYGFASSMDIHGRVALGVPDNQFGGAPLLQDPYDSTNPATSTLPNGMPVIDMVSSFLTTEIVNSAYEMDFSRAPFSPSLLGDDTGFSPREMESLLRRYDWDSSMLPNRLRLLLQSSFNTADLEVQHSLTSDSMEVPVPPESLVDRLHRALSEFNTAKFGAWPQPADPAPPSPAPQPWTAAHVNTSSLNIQWMLAPEIIQGRKMDMNFPLGNGRDDNGNGVVDESAESVAIPGELRPDPYGRNFAMDYDHDATTVNDSQHQLARQNFARHLYVLVLLTTQYVDRNGDGLVNGADWFDYNNSGGAADLADLYDYRRDVAQWVANIVDFRDPDSICTGFEFDLNPWDGWQVDGDVNTDDSMVATMAFLDPAMVGPLTIPGADRFVVWGAERPELLLTESFVTHDRRTQDLNSDPTGQQMSDPESDPLNDLDSRLVPNASCFIELYNPWFRGTTANAVANTDVFPAEFYGVQGVDLRRMDQATGTAPVWRVEVMGVRNNLVRPIRTVYFQRPTDPKLQSPLGAQNRVFFPTAMSASELQPGQYAVLGSTGVQAGTSYTTYLGRRNTASWNLELADTRRITLDTGASQVSVRWWDDPNSTWATTVRNNVLTIPVGREEDGSAGGAVRSLGLTDPTIGYDAASRAAPPMNPNASVRAVPDGLEFFDTGTNIGLTFDEPIDRQANATDWNELPQITFDETSGTFQATVVGVPNQGLYESGVHSSARVIVLKRLANPLIAWNPDPSDPEDGLQHDVTLPINPYLPVDYLGADVAVFNGVTNLGEDGVAEAVPTDRSFVSMERSSNFPGLRNLWRADETGRNAILPYTAYVNPDMHFQSENMRDSLGEPDLEFRTAAVNAYPWLTWNNRPYVSHLELANVPRGANGQILRQFSLFQNPAGGGASFYNGIDTSKVTRNDWFRGRFEHLPDFFSDAFSVSTTGNPGLPPLQSFLDYVEVPSRFVGTEFELNPLVFAASVDGVAADGSGCEAGFLTFRYNPPYNTVSRFRNPGKLNLNTVSRPGVWNGFMGSYATAGGFYALADSRRDLGVTPPLYYPTAPLTPPGVPFVSVHQSVDLPSDFPFVFRAAGKGNFVPEVYVPAVAAVNPRNIGKNGMVQRSAQPTLFRAPDPANPDSATQPMFDYLAPPTQLQADPARNAFFRHDMRQRLGNTVTNKSSVFSVWITVGFFELADDGTISSNEGAARQRGFYMIDRSIPVAFEPGRNHNVERVILTSSIID